jgi:DNA polymerase III subunit epsilon
MPCATNEAEHINNIKAEWTRCNKPTDISYNQLNAMADAAQYLVAHNAKFDKKFVANYRGFVNTKWICTKDDFKWPVLLQRMRLQDICQAMGVQYVGAHRALNDCQFIADCFSKIGDLEERLLSAGNNSFNTGRYR